MYKPFNFKQRFQAFGLHLAASSAVALGIAALVLGMWFPGAYRYMAGGLGLLGLILAVDVVLGPVLTFLIFNTKKSRAHLRRDIATIALIQAAALGYGIYTIYWARPVVLAFEGDRFRVLSAADVLIAELPDAPPELRKLSWFGPKAVAVRKAQEGAERTDSISTAIFSGVDTSQRPKFWLVYGDRAKAEALDAGRSFDQLILKHPEATADVRAILERHELNSASAKFLPVFAKADAVAVLRPDGTVAGFLPYDGFF